MFNSTHKCIMKTFNGIMMVALTAIFSVFCGCSQDEDDYNNSDMYTLAEEMGTRGGGGDPGGNTPQKKKVHWKKEVAGNTPKPTGFLNPVNMSSPAGLPNSTDPILDGEYDTSTLTISFSNFNGSADIYIYTVQGHNMMDVTTTNVVNGTSIDFSLSGYTIGVDYEIYVSLCNGEAYVGQFVL